MKLPFNLRVIITAVLSFLVWSHIAWDYFHGGIPTHYLLHNADLPGIPNWLGGIVLPFFTWFLLFRIHKRIDDPKQVNVEQLSSVVRRFLIAMIVAISIAVLFTLEIDFIEYIMLGIFILAFVFPLYKSEYLLGWVVGSSFTFGAIIPIGFGSLFLLVFYILYKAPRAVLNYFGSGNTN